MLSTSSLADDLRSKITSGALHSESLLGTEIGLTKTTGLSRSSVRLAISTLINEGLVERRPGKGVFVKSSSTSSVIELVLPALQNIWIDIAEGVQTVGRNTGSKIQIFNARSDVKSDMNMLRSLPSLKVDGAIIGSLHQKELTQEIVHLHLSGLPIVLLDQNLSDINVPSVTFDNYQAGYLAGSELLKANHRNLGFVGYSSLSARINGLRDAVNDAGIAFDRKNIVDTPVSWIPEGEQKRSLKEALTSLMDQPNPPTGLVFHNTGMALQGVRRLQSLGLRIPKDISVVSIGNEPEWIWADTELSAVQLPALEMGRIAAEMLLERIQNSQVPVRHVVLPVSWKPGHTILKLRS